MRRVKPSLYTREYYLTDCTGHEEFKKTWGRKLEPRLKRIVREIPIRRNMKILDIGCGRGELVFWAARKGAEVVGIDYSQEAIKLAQEAKEKRSQEDRKKISFLLVDAKDLKFPDKSFDAVFLVEVFEHLYPEEQEKVFKEVLRVLKKEGFVFVHTAPARWFNDYTYRFYCYPVSTLIVSLWNKLKGRNYGNLQPWKELRIPSHKIMHINEPNYFSLKKLFNKHGFLGKIRSTNITVLKPELSWKDKLFNSLVYLYPLGNYFPFNIFWGNDFLSVLKRK